MVDREMLDQVEIIEDEMLVLLDYLSNGRLVVIEARLDRDGK